MALERGKAIAGGKHDTWSTKDHRTMYQCLLQRKPKYYRQQKLLVRKRKVSKKILENKASNLV